MPIGTLRPGSYVAFLPCRMQLKQKIMKQIISLSIVSIVFDTAEMRRMNRALGSEGLRKGIDPYAYAYVPGKVFGNIILDGKREGFKKKTPLESREFQEWAWLCREYYLPSNAA